MTNTQTRELWLEGKGGYCLCPVRCADEQMAERIAARWRDNGAFVVRLFSVSTTEPTDSHLVMAWGYQWQTS